ncbi:MAG TPA: MoaD/ThiS family protein [Planctomycetota bacterium]|nr:MoaD/ThiS family protein [Planctomycetota bacterium]
MPDSDDDSGRGVAAPRSDASITVQVMLRSILGKYRPDPKDRTPFARQLPAGSTVRDLLAALGVPERVAKLVFVDHVRCDASVVLGAGAHVDVFPPIAGG